MVYNSTKGRRERIGRLIRMYADRREDIDEVLAGDIGAVLGLKESFTGDTLCDAANPVVLEHLLSPNRSFRWPLNPKPP
jgi:elongation factor G